MIVKHCKTYSNANNGISKAAKLIIVYRDNKIIGNVTFTIIKFMVYFFAAKFIIN